MGFKRTLTGGDVLGKKFRASVKGYDADEVDAFLDRVLVELRNVETFLVGELPALEKSASQLEVARERIRALEIELAVLKDKFGGLAKNDTVEVNQNNLELHRRISALEKALYKLGQDPVKIK